MKPTISSADINALLCLLPNTDADMQLIAQAQPVRLKTTYFGTDGQHCLFFRYPASTEVVNTTLLIEPDMHIVIRYVLDEPYGEVVAFKVRILKVIHSPVPMVITSFPSVLQKLGLRSEKRAISGVPVEVVLDEQENKQVEGLIVDISQNGCKLLIPFKTVLQVIQGDEKITLCVELADRTMLLAARVKNARIEKDYHAYGIRFADHDNQLERLLERYMITL
ncbi:flagellar brake protein [Brumicola nitratireducens]|uniref:Type IV pilus assembly PilZ n=1 Tax=Glaciecola nitratireducens (strain JCM 12485 / KCTC 12276 / FR1064) TaxID=1085623 RepID=G4QLI8_GLANF|nr:flagellar brake protein [Glaciecola nitratireducens]AEP30094.1 type IV pilus assembly PilZ [Glaciecola nitratireducens FR1064]